MPSSTSLNTAVQAEPNGTALPASFEAESLRSGAEHETAPIKSDARSHQESDEAAYLTVIEPARLWQFIDLSELWRHRELLFRLAARDIKVRYKQTVLGAAWAVLQPVAMMLVFTIFFGRMAKVPHGSLPYPVFVLAGLIPWMFFSTALTSSANSVIASERLITKVYFPRLAIPLAAVGAAFVDSLVAIVGLVLLMLHYEIAPSASLVVLPLVAILIGLAALGFGTFLAALTVRYRDFKHVTPFLVQIWLFATPSVYMQTGHHRTPPAVDGASATLLDAVTHWLQHLLAANPLTPLIATFRAAMLGLPIDYVSLAASAAGVAVIFAVGCFYFRCVEDSFADVI